MRYHLLLILLICFTTSYSQSFIAAPSAPEPKNTYAVVIGISSYADPDITQLEFSNRDAKFFADYLMSASGGSVPKQNIKLLLDSGATVGEVDKAIRWLKNNSKEDDNVYFYFSGHGALENVSMFNNGYLICYNSPSVAFANMALSINYLNDIASTLSLKTKANVIIITDACHSGKLAGSQSNGNYLVGEQLLKASQKEIRMASSKPDQLSNEKRDWGGGRGVFSYHLVNGLQGGLADMDRNQTVSLGELKDYMETSMANDPVLKSDGEVQTPVIKGRSDFELSKVVKSEAAKVILQATNDSIAHVQLLTAAPLDDAEPEEIFFSLLKQENIELLTGEMKLDVVDASAIPFDLIGRLMTGSISPFQKSKLAELMSALEQDKEKLEEFKISIGRCINDRGQDVILKYLKGDEAELERRRYYNAASNGYDIYPRMFKAALNLSKADKYIAGSTEVLMHYFSAVALRLKIPFSNAPASLIDKAFNEIKKALDLEEHAAYIYNELGILYQFKKDLKKAEENYTRASQLSPNWAVPYSNLCGLYGLMGKYADAAKQCQVADSLQPGLQSVAIHEGVLNEKQRNFLFAEESYRKAIDINARHFVPFERLGHTYLNTTDYAMADSFFYEADLRKKGYHFKGNEWQYIEQSIVALPYAPLHCEIDSNNLLPKDIFSFFTWGVQEYEEWKHYDNAVKLLRNVIAHDRTNPLVFHYLGKIYYDQQKWEEAELMFRFALKYGLPQDRFDLYVDSVVRSFRYPYDHTCVENYFSKKYYSQREDHYFIGTVYQQWKHVEEAESHFRQLITIDSGSIGGYIKLWNLYERQGRFAEAEETIRAYAAVEPERSDRELNEFYRRTIDKFPNDPSWYYRLGNLLYERASANARVPYFDSIAWFPLLNKELHIDLDIYRSLQTKKEYTLSDQAETGAVGMITIDENTLIEQRGSYDVPGTHERILLADVIYMPRKDGILYLKRAAELVAEKEALADINFKIGNIYRWAGSKRQAFPFFEKSLEFVPDNANARLTLVDIYTALYWNRSALSQLKYLYDSSQINFEKRLLLAKFNIHAGDDQAATTLLTKAAMDYPYPHPEIYDLAGRLKLLDAKYPKAILAYEQVFKLSTQYEVKRMAAYNLARAYSASGKQTEAHKWLETAIALGFNYGYVLNNDPLIKDLLQSLRGRALLNGVKQRVYLVRNTIR